MTRTLSALCLGWLALCAVDGRAAGDGAPGSVSRDLLVERLQAPEARPLERYRARRYLTASTRGGRMTAEMEVLTSYDERDRFHWEVVRESGSGVIRKRVLRAALQAEEEGQSAEQKGRGALTADNYEFLDVSVADDSTMRLGMKARRKHPLLVNGALYFDAASSDLLLMEGELSRRPSFWTRRAYITRQYGRIGGVRVPVAMWSTADVRLVGESSFSMTYEYLEINGQPVAP